MKPAVIEQGRVLELKKIVPEYYSRNPLVRWLFKKRLRLACEYVKRLGPKSLLDLGCGDGSFIRFLLEGGIAPADLQAVDLNPQVAGLGTLLAPCKFSCQDLTRTGFEDRRFDAIVSLDVLEHLPDLTPALREMERLLVPRGFLITSAPTESWIYKSLRFLLKGTFSEASGPGAGRHYHDAAGIEEALRCYDFQLLEKRTLPLGPPWALFHVNLYQGRAR